MMTAEGDTTMPRPLVSVIVPVHKCIDYLEQALRSVLDQDGPPIEVIVIDSSTKESRGFVPAMADARVRRYFQEPRGVSAARNVGIQQARGEFIAFQDADDEWLPGKLELQIQALRKFPEAALAFTDSMMFRGTTVIQASMNRHMLEDWCRSHGSDLSGCYYGPLYPQLLMRDCMNTSAVMIRRSVLDSHDGFDETFKVGEDYDLWLRIAKQYPMIFIDRVLTKYRVHAEGLSGGDDVRTLRWLEAHMAVRKKHQRLQWVPSQHTKLLTDIQTERAWEAGWNYFGRNQLHDARRHFCTVIRSRPFDPKIWLYWCCSFLPVWAVEVIRVVRKSAGMAHQQP
jgi:glycosyltransferase involved in cell wall biosynthesis